LFVTLDIGDVTVFMTGTTKEIAELAVCNTDIGRIDIPVDLPGHLAMWYLYLAQFIGYESQISCGCILI